MADVPRTRAELLTLFADNAAGDISAQDQRDFVVSAYTPQGFAGGRLTLESGVPISTADQAAKTNVYYTPFTHNLVGLYDGTSWKLYTFTEKTLALGTITADKNYDVFLYDNAGTLTLELSAAWTNDTTRADALTTQDGVYVKSGATTRRYLGTIRTTATTTTEDSARRRFVWNANNRVLRKLRVSDATVSWTYATVTWRQARATVTNQAEVVIGLAGPAVDLTLIQGADTTASTGPHLSIGADSITVPSADLAPAIYMAANGAYIVSTIREVFVPALGYHYYAWLEKAGTTSSHTLYGAPASGMQGIVDA